MRAVDDDEYAFRIVRDEGPSTIRYGLAESLSEMSPAQFVTLTKTEPHFGGTRYWFQCPRGSCNRRCSVLYREPHSNARALACRRCIRFRYKTQVLGETELIVSRIEKLLGQVAFQPDGKVCRPKGMHRRTFRGITSRLNVQTARYKKESPLVRQVERDLAKCERWLRSELHSPCAEVSADVTIIGNQADARSAS